MGRGTVNKVILMGRLGADPELRYTASGTAVATFNMATNMVWRNQDGDMQEKTEWHRVVVWRKLAEFAGEWLKKGSYVYVEGRLQTRSWEDKDGNKRFTTEVVADSVQFVGSKKDERTTDTFEPPLPAEYPEETSDESSPQEDDLPF
ncbi:single-stranded DNA-binding protein [candidate division KSB1 bacterium]|nr:single-stranded DNA-binding protein [candidate division KSB1 bacterium]